MRASMLLVAMLSTALPAGAQQDRAGLIDEARAESDLLVALDTYFTAAEPVAIDSLWAVSVYEIAQILRDLDDEPASDTWLRWAARLGPDWPVDPDWFTPTLVTAYEAAVQAVGPGGGEGQAPETTWSWPNRYVRGSGGTIVVVATDPSIQVTVTLENGATTTSLSSALGAPTGTHLVEATAPDYEPRRFQVEALPGVSATIWVEMLPLLPATAGERAISQILRLRYDYGGIPACTNAVALREGLLVAALDQLRTARNVELVLGDRVYDNLEVVERNEETGLAFLQIQEGPTLQIWTGAAEETGFGWSLHRQGCDTVPVATRLRLLGSGDALTADLPPGIVPAAAGAPIIDASGALLGLIVGGGRVTPASRVEGVTQTVAARLGHGGFPFKWVGAGLAAAAGALVYLLGGGENPSTGSIVIEIPSS